MSQITKGETFADGDQVTGAKLNQLVDQAKVTAEIITIQDNMDAGTVASNDTMLVYDISETGLREANVSDVLSSNLPVITSSITGQATQISALTSDITITPNDAEIVTGKNYTSADSSTIVVTSTAHGLAVGQVVKTSAASTGTFNGTFRIVAANTDTFTYTIPLTVLPSSGTFSSSNGTLVTVTTPVAHGLSTGNSVAFVTSNSAFNITTTITVVNSTSFTYSLGTVYGTGSGTFTSSNNQYTVVTTSSNHNLVDGTSIAVTASTGAFSGTYPITSLTATTFAYSIATPFGSVNASSAYNNNVSPYKITVTKTAHGLSTGNSIVVTCTSGNTTQNSYISGTHTITVVDANTFTYPKSQKITTFNTGTPASATLAISYVFSSSTTGTVTYVLGNPYTGSISYTASPTGASGTLSYLKKGVVKNTNSKIINGNLYVDGTTTLNSDIRLVGNMTNFGSLTQNGAVTQNGTVTQTGTVNITGALQSNGVPAYVLFSNESGSFTSMTNWVAEANSVPVRITTYSTTWFVSGGFLHGTDNLVVPTNEVWEVNYVFSWRNGSDDVVGFSASINDVAINPQPTSPITSAWTYLPASVSKVLTAGTYAIKFKSTVFGGTGVDATYCDPYAFGSRNLKKYKVS